MAWRIPETDIEQVKRSTDLRALVQSRGIELKKHGSKDWIGRCPFHNDQDNPNFIVTPDKGLFPLHGLRQGGQRRPVRSVP
jgi:DNA primase